MTDYNTLLTKFSNSYTNKIELNPNIEFICCDTELIILNSHYTCRICGLTKDRIFSADAEYIPSKYTYTRLNHLKFKLNKLNGRDNDKIPDNVINQIKEHEFYDIYQLRKVMKKLKFGFYYKNIHYIWSKIKGYPLFVMSREFEDKINIQFREIIEKYFDCEERRIQFINYNYFIFKLCFLNNKPEIAQHIPFISTHKKTISSYDETFKKICEKLNWTFVDTPTQLKLIKDTLKDKNIQQHRTKVQTTDR
jgi:hypothetical protein